MNPKVCFVVLFLWNLVVMAVYGADKAFAKRRHQRISERTLLLLPLLLGAPGAMFGMVIFNHKTSKAKFRVWIPAEVIFNVATVCLLVYLKTYYS